MKKENQKKDFKSFYQNLPETPGVYIMKDKSNNVLYVGKAANLKRRVSSYFLKPQDKRLEMLIQKIAKIDFIKTTNALNALILEADLIKKYRPPFNIKEKDDRSFLFIEITDEEFPRVHLVRGKEKKEGVRFGPFVIAKDAKEALGLIRKIFPFSTHTPKEINSGKPCFYYQIGLCPGTCVGKISQKEYKETIKNIKLLLEGKEKNLIKKLEKDMKSYAQNLEFEKAQKIKNQITALKHLEDVLFIREEKEFVKEKTKKRIEGYDISNIGGDYAIGSLVVFEDENPKKEDYRIFKIKEIKGINDLGMIEEVIKRRLKHKEWPYPDLILVDGGENQVNVVKKVLEKENIRIPVLGIAKGPKRKRNDFYGEIPEFTSKEVLIKVRDEAHRFALKNHRKLRKKEFLK